MPMDATAAAAELDRAALDELGSSFAGELVRPDDPGYEEHRAVWNGSIDRHPALIARCAGADDVVAALRFANRTDVPLAVRSGGHSFPGLSVCDAGLVVDLRKMSEVRVDPDARKATVGAGALLGELDAATQEHGLVVPAGIVTHTGVAGLTLGGGIGWVMRKHGLTIDQLLSVRVVTASGELVRATREENADLFWGIRGGGGNFGIVTEFEFRLNELGPQMLAGPIFWRMTDSPEVLRFYRDWIAEAPDELMTIIIHRRAPPLDFVPQELHGEHVVAVVCCYAGSIEEGERVVKPMRKFGQPVLDLCEPKPFLQHQSMFDPSFPHGRWYYLRSCDVAELSDDVIDTTVEHSLRMASPYTAFPIWQMGGAVARVDEDDSAFNGRGVGHTFNVNAATLTADGFEEEREWARGLWSALEPHHMNTVYVNFLMEEGQDRVVEAYGAERYNRLQQLKRKYDPDNLFRLNQNIPPA
jgi:hypothetical protein